MKPRLIHRLVAYVPGFLSEGELRQLQTSFDESPILARDAAMLQEALARRAHTLQPIAPTSATRERLLATLAGVDRFRPFFERVCEMVDLPQGEVRRILARIDDAAAWEPGPVPELHLSHFQPGPRLTSFDAGLVRLGAGQSMPRHRHRGPEVALVLEGVLWEAGIGHFPGDVLERAAGSIHGFTAGSERDLVFVVTHCGVEIV